ncbi:MAG: hypothetical protein ACFCBW_12005 [Candidatus Competibacterales bacterium]
MNHLALAAFLLLVSAVVGLAMYQIPPSRSPTPPKAVSPTPGTVERPGSTVAQWVAQTQSALATERHRAVAALGELAAKGVEGSVAPLVKTVKSAVIHDRQVAVKALVQAAAAGNRAALDPLLAIAQDIYLLNRYRTLVAMALAAPGSPIIEDALASLLKGYSPSQRELAFDALAEALGRDAPLYRRLQRQFWELPAA